MRHLPIWLVVFLLFGQHVSGEEMSSEMKRRRGRGSNKRKINRRPRLDKIGESLMEVTFNSICNTTEYNPFNGSSTIVGSDTVDMCSTCFLNYSLEEMFTSEVINKTQTCVKQYLPNRYQVCADMMQNGNSTEDVIDCLKDGLMNSTILECNLSSRPNIVTVDVNDTEGVNMLTVESVKNMTKCLKRNKQDFKRRVRMAMMDRAIGKEGCSFSALIALKMFGGKSKSMGKSMDWDDAFDNMLEEQLEEDDDDDKPFTWNRKSGGKRGSSGGRGGMSNGNYGGGRNQENNNQGGNFNRGSSENGGQRPRRSQGGNGGWNQNNFNYGRGSRGGKNGGRNNQGGFGGGRNPPVDENNGGESDDDYYGEDDSSYEGDDISIEFK